MFAVGFERFHAGSFLFSFLSFPGPRLDKKAVSMCSNNLERFFVGTLLLSKKKLRACLQLVLTYSLELA